MPSCSPTFKHHQSVGTFVSHLGLCHTSLDSALSHTLGKQRCSSLSLLLPWPRTRQRPRISTTGLGPFNAFPSDRLPPSVSPFLASTPRIFPAHQTESSQHLRNPLPRRTKVWLHSPSELAHSCLWLCESTSITRRPVFTRSVRQKAQGNAHQGPP